MIERAKVKIGDHVYLITHDKNRLTVTHKAIIIGFKEDHHICQLETDDVLKITKFRRDSQVFKTEEEAKTELDQFYKYCEYRNTSHKK